MCEKHRRFITDRCSTLRYNDDKVLSEGLPSMTHFIEIFKTSPSYMRQLFYRLAIEQHQILTVPIMPLTRIRQLASIIVDRTVDIDGKLEATGLPTPSFDPESSSSLLFDELAESRALLLEATEELHALMLGPIGLLTSHSVRRLELKSSA